MLEDDEQYAGKQDPGPDLPGSPPETEPAGRRRSLRIGFVIAVLAVVAIVAIILIATAIPPNAASG